MRVVVTGAAGFIGSHLAQRLLSQGHEVVGIDNLRTGSMSNVELLQRSDAFSMVKQDVSETLFVDGTVDAILHFASPASPIDFPRIPIQILKANAVGTWHTLGLAKAKDARYLLASTSEAYGDPLVHPQPESYLGNVNPVGIRGVYDESKRFAEAMAMAYHRAHDMDTRIARIFNTYGPRMRLDDGRVVPAFLSAALAGEPLRLQGGGVTTRSFCYVDDLVDGLLALLMLDRAEDTAMPVNIGNPNEFTIRELAALVLELTNSSSEMVDAPLPPDDPMQRRPDITRARQLLNWEPRIELREGLTMTIEAFRGVSS